MRLAILAAAAVTLLGLATTDRAGACSCAQIDPEERLKQVDAAVIGTVLSDDGKVGRIRVEHEFKVDLPAEIEVGTGDEESACELSLEPGRRIGLFLTRAKSGRWSSSLCDMVDPDDLPGAEERLPRPLGEGTAALVAYGSFSAGRVALLDGEGRPLAYGAGRGTAERLGVCPGSRHVVELVRDGARPSIAIRRVRDAAVVRQRRSPWRGNVSRVACGDPDGRKLFAVVGRRRSTSVAALEDGRPRTIHAGRYVGAELIAPYAILVRRRGADLLDLRTGRVRRLRGVRGHSESWALSPDGTRAAGIAPGFDRRDFAGAVMLVDLARRTRAIVRPAREDFTLTNAVLWLDDDRLLVAGDSRRLRLVDDALRTLRTFRSRLEPAGLVIAGGGVYGVDDETLRVAEGPDLAQRDLARLPARGISSLAALPDAPQVDVTP
ncbi:MAG TPA: hypothetical protein VF529_16445 [Solirubrobacteraceae bacterium]|jgi:hypothetical protein